MADERPLPEPTAEQFLHEYEQQRNQRMLLHNSEVDDSQSSQPTHPRYTITRLVEGNLIPVTDRAGQQLAKRCADLYDLFIASATTDTDTDAATDIDNDSVIGRHTTANNHPPNEATAIASQTTPHITPRTTPQTTSPTSQPSRTSQPHRQPTPRPPEPQAQTTPQPNPHPQTTPNPNLNPPPHTTPNPNPNLNPHPQTTPNPPNPTNPHPHPHPQTLSPPLQVLHIPAPHLNEYTTALHNLLTPTHPPALLQGGGGGTTTIPPTGLTPTHLAHLHHHLQTQQHRLEKRVAEREASLAERGKVLVEREGVLGERERVVVEREGVLGGREREVVEREGVLGERERAVLEREAVARVLFDEGLLAGQLAEVRRMGVEEGLRRAREGEGVGVGVGVGVGCGAVQGLGQGVVSGMSGSGNGHGSGSGSGSGSGNDDYGGGPGNGPAHGQGNNTQVMPMGSYLAVINAVLDWVRKARALARCPPPLAQQQLEKLEAQLVRLVDEGRAVMADAVVAPGLVVCTPPLLQVQNRGNETQSGTSDGRPLVDKGKGRMMMPSQSGNRDYEMPDGAALLADLKRKAMMLEPLVPAGGNQLGESSAAVAAQAVDKGNLETAKLVNMEEVEKGDAAQQQY